MKDISHDKLHSLITDRTQNMKSHLENVLTPLHMNRNDGGSSSSLDSKDSKSGKINGNPLILEDHEKKWFRYIAKCDLEQLKKLYKIDNELINRKDNFTGYAAIHWAAKKGRFDIIRWAYEMKADMDARTSGGYTALHMAVIHKNELTIKRLINDHCADINVRDYSGKKPRHYISPDISLATSRALQETPSVIELQVDPKSERVVIEGFATPTAIRRSIRNPMMKSATMDTRLDDDHQPTSGMRRLKKKGLALSSSFKMKKRSHYVTKRESRICLDTVPSSPNVRKKFERSPSVPDMVIYAELENNRRKSIVDYEAIVNPDDDDFEHETIIPNGLGGRKNSVSDMLINGYAGLIKENKHHRKPSAAENKDYSINTWI